MTKTLSSTSTRAAQRRQVPTEVRRRQLVEAATRVVVAEGLERATTRRIATEAGVPLGALHYAFPDKEALFAAVYDHWVEGSAWALADHVPEGVGLADGVRRLLEVFFQASSSNRSEVHAQYSLLFWALSSPTTQELPSRVYDAYTRVVCEALDRATGGVLARDQLTDLTQLVGSAIDGIGLQFLAYGDEQRTRADIERFVALIERGYRPSAAAGRTAKS